MKRRDFLIAAAGGAVVSAQPRAARASEPVRVLVPDADNLQYLAFWVARALGMFDGGFAVDVASPPSPQQARAWLDEQKPDVAILPPPLYLQLISDRAPYVLAANLLMNDPIELIARKTVAAARGVSRDQPLRERLERLRGVKLGIAPHPPPRLRALYASVGLDADRELEIVIIGGRRQNAAFESGQVDALYAHTPFLEQAIVHQDAVVIVDQAGGEVSALANRQIHVLAFSRSFLERRRADAVTMVRAIARAQALIRSSPSDTAAALSKAFPDRERVELDLIAQLYRNAVPATPAVSIDGLAPALLFFPEGQDKPSLSGIDLASYVATDLTREATAKPAARRSMVGVEIATGVLVIAALGWRFRAHRLRDPSAGRK